MQLYRPSSVLWCLTWSPTSSHAPALPSCFKCILFYAKWLGVLFRRSVTVIIFFMTWMCRGEARCSTYCAGTFSTKSQPFSFLEDEIAQGELHLISPHSKVLLQSTEYAVCLTSALESPFMFLSRNCLWQAVVALYFHSTVEIIEYMSNVTVLNSFGLNISPWEMPLVTVGFPTVHCYPLCLKM